MGALKDVKELPNEFPQGCTSLKSLKLPHNFKKGQHREQPTALMKHCQDRIAGEGIASCTGTLLRGVYLSLGELYRYIQWSLPTCSTLLQTPFVDMMSKYSFLQLLVLSPKLSFFTFPASKGSKSFLSHGRILYFFSIFSQIESYIEPTVLTAYAVASAWFHYCHRAHVECPRSKPSLLHHSRIHIQHRRHSATQWNNAECPKHADKRKSSWQARGKLPR